MLFINDGLLYANCSTGDDFKENLQSPHPRTWPLSIYLTFNMITPERRIIIINLKISKTFAKKLHLFCIWRLNNKPLALGIGLIKHTKPITYGFGEIYRMLYDLKARLSPFKWARNQCLNGSSCLMEQHILQTEHVFAQVKTFPNAEWPANVFVEEK